MKKISLLFVILCLVLCLVFAVSCNDPADSDTDVNTESETDVNSESDVASDSDSDTAVDEYRVYIKDNDNNPLNLVKVTYCDYVETGVCKTAITNVDGYVVVPNANYHVSGVKDLNGVYVELTELEIHFQEGKNEIEIILLDKVEAE